MILARSIIYIMLHFRSFISRFAKLMTQPKSTLQNGYPSTDPGGRPPRARAETQDGRITTRRDGGNRSIRCTERARGLCGA